MDDNNPLIDPRLQDTSGSGNKFFPRPPDQAYPAPITNTAPRPPAPPQSQYQPIQDGIQPPQLYMPQTPQSTGNLTDEGGNGTHDGGPNDPKRPRACEACRGLKVRCEPDPQNPDGPCKRCAKANRNCVVTVPSRKRQKKADSRVAELERKIDALTATLQATKSGSTPIAQSTDSGPTQRSPNPQVRPNPYEQVTNGGYDSSFASRPEARIGSNEWAGYPSVEYDSKKPIAPPMVMAGQKRKHTDSREASSDGRASVFSGVKKSWLTGDEPGSQKTPQMHEYADVVDRGILTADVASLMFNNYVEKMAPHMPAVVFNPGTTAAEIRKTKPTLFLAILSASSGTSHPDEQKPLTKELMSIFAERIICNGEKTMELVQALHISTLWYWPPEHFEELKFYQLIHIAAVMAIDIGMGKRNKTQKSKAGLWRDHPWRRTPFPDPESIEARRTWLGCFILCCNASMGLRRPNLIRWSSFMADSVDVLETSPEAAPSDRVLCQWVRSQRIAEDIGIQFSMDDPVATVNISDPKVQYALKRFEHDLEKWSNQIPADVQTPSLTLTHHVVNLYMHEIAMHIDHNVDEFKPPFTEITIRGSGGTPDALTPAHISALSTCLESIDGIFETFLKFDIEIVRCLPIAHFVRVAYAVVVLIKMYFAAATPNSELGKVINKDNMKVEQYLDGLVDIFRSSAAGDKSRPAAKFLMVLIMLKTWFHRQREGKLVPPNSVEASTVTRTEPTTETPNEKPQQPQQPQQQSVQQRNVPQPGYGPTNTPLQLLSEVATGNSGGSRPDSANTQYTGTQSDWQQQPQTFPNYDPSMQLPQTAFPGYPGANFDPAFGMDIMGDGFEQAMGMTLGLGDYGYFNEDMFGAIIDSALPNFDV